eukprot:433353-Pyramimonas_sp.AAC.1
MDSRRVFNSKLKGSDGVAVRILQYRAAPGGLRGMGAGALETFARAVLPASRRVLPSRAARRQDWARVAVDVGQ